MVEVAEPIGVFVVDKRHIRIIETLVLVYNISEGLLIRLLLVAWMGVLVVVFTGDGVVVLIIVN